MVSLEARLRRLEALPRPVPRVEGQGDALIALTKAVDWNLDLLGAMLRRIEAGEGTEADAALLARLPPVEMAPIDTLRLVVKLADV